MTFVAADKKSLSVTHYMFLISLYLCTVGRGTVQLVEARHLKTGGPAFDLRLGPWKFQVT